MSFRAPLSEQEIAEAELDLGIAFPVEYRSYLKRQSAVGPIARLEKTDRGWWWTDNPWRRRERLAIPFPHPDSYVEADEALHARWPQVSDFVDDASHEAALATWVRERDAFDDHKTAGAIIAQEHGCGFATLFVLTGPLAGTFWWDGRATCDLILPLSRDHADGAPPVTFEEWVLYGSWNLLPPGWG